MHGDASVLCGQILVTGLSTTSLTAREREDLARGRRGGVVLFRRNLDQGDGLPRQVAGLLRDVVQACGDHDPPLTAVDQEGGRVARLGPPFLSLPAMRRIGDLNDLDFARRLAEAQARELAAVGFTMSFAPVADVHSRADNPIIGDRAFSSEPVAAGAFATAWAEGLTAGGLRTCAKHFPGHGDTSVDSHLALPVVAKSREDLERVELVPFAALAKLPRTVHAMMTAHVVYPALDDRPATLAAPIATTLLRSELGFSGVLFSDDLEMKAIQMPGPEAAVLSIAAGCDVLLVCSDPDLADAVHEGLVREVEKSAAFRARCEEAHGRFQAMRPRPGSPSEELSGVFARSAPLRDELAARLEAHR